MINATNSLKDKFHVRDETYIQKSIGHFLSRSINSMYRPKFKKETAFRLNFLKTINTKEDLNRLLYWNENNAFQKNMINLLEKKKFKLADFYLKTFFSLRYSLEPLWVKSRRFLIKK